MVYGLYMKDKSTYINSKSVASKSSNKLTSTASLINYDKTDLKKTQLDSFRPLDINLVKNLEEWFKVELTYTSNAIEGNTLTRAETALVVEKGLTVGGKSLVEHLEATNHASALDWVKKQINRKPHEIYKISIKDILKIHEIILKGIDDNNAGNFRNVAVRISGSAVILPNPKKVYNLMEEFALWFEDSKKNKIHPIQFAAEAHYKLVTIHPFTDGNGRTARLLMNLILMIYGYPPAIIRPRDRLAYINSLEKAQLVNGENNSKNDFYKIILKAVDKSLDIYLKAVTNSDEDVENTNDNNSGNYNSDNEKLLKIGELAKKTGETNSTIRHWTKNGLLGVTEITDSGYQMYSSDAITKIQKIRELQSKRYTLDEIKNILENQL
jgi:Fic family protein